MNGEEFLKRDYPGRGVIIGFNEGVTAGVYFLMGRGESSKARVLEREVGVIRTKPTNMELLSKGRPELLIYNAVISFNDLLVLSNGRHTDTLFTEQLSLNGDLCLKILNSLNQWSFEPDAPNYTPRIAGVLNEDEAYLSIIKRVSDNPFIESYQVSKGELCGITTYSGVNKSPLPAYEGEPFKLSIKAPTHYDLRFSIDDETDKRHADEDSLDEAFTAKFLGDYVWNLLNPDYRVSLASIIVRHEHKFSGAKMYIPNRGFPPGDSPFYATRDIDSYIINKNV